LANLLLDTIIGLKKTRQGNINELLLVIEIQTQPCLYAVTPAKDDYADPAIPLLNKYSNWERLVRIVAYFRRVKTRRTGQISRLEKIEAIRALVLHSQRASYRSTLFQLKTHGRVNYENALAPLTPFLDKDGMIRLSGRTEAAPFAYEEKYPLLLHAKDPITEVLLRFLHKQLMHSGGPRALQTELSKFYWTPKVTTLLRKIAYQCVVCRKKFAKPTTRRMAPLPFFCLPSQKLNPFDHLAIDVAGPFYITFDKKKQKCWMLVIRCATIRAVHIEMLKTMKTFSL
jgi:hypothetical protein